MPDATDRPAITPDLKVGALLDAYPELEDVLIDVAPAFKKLRNPVLRRTVAKLTSLRQAAQVGGVSLGELIGRLRAAVGDAEEWSGDERVSTHPDERPEWLDAGTVIETFNAITLIESGGQPLPTVMAALKRLDPGQLYAIITPFMPAPMIDKAREAGYQTWTEQTGETEFRTTFRSVSSRQGRTK